MLIIASLPGPTLDDLRRQIQDASTKNAAVAEVRFDLLKNIDLRALQELHRQSPLPWMVTIRKEISSYADVLQTVISWAPAYLDIESDSSADPYALGYRGILVRSSHYYRGIPDNLRSVMNEMRKRSADIYKIAATCHCSLDALRLFTEIRAANSDFPHWVGVGMGTQGEMTRSAAAVTGSPWMYACLDSSQATAPGQLSIDDLKKLYRSDRGTLSTALFSLIGDPVEHSRSHRTHNRVFGEMNVEAIYLKIAVAPTDLSSFVEQVRELPFKGFSVTMPHKEAIVPHLDVLDPSAVLCGAVNTIKCTKDKLIGYNTDGLGAWNALAARGVNPQGLQVFIAGAGGTAKAIAAEGQRRGGHITLFSRNKERGIVAARAIGCEWKGLDELPHAFENTPDIFINATPVGMFPHVDGTVVEPSLIPASAILLDVVSKPAETRLIREFRVRGGSAVSGLEMFVHQAVAQFSIWFDGRLQDRTVQDILEQELYDSIVR